MFSHIMIGTNDFATSVAFYDAVLSCVGLHRTTKLDQVGPAGVLWQKEQKRWPQFAIRHPIDREPASAGNGAQVSFQCSSRNAVDKAWKAALNHGGFDEGAPGDRPIYDDDFYAAYVRDPEGNKLCFLFCRDFRNGHR